MQNEAREFGLFIDGLRIERNFSREDLCDGIISISQYKRYLKGDTSIPNEILILLADRLKFSINDIYHLFRKKHNDDYKKISEIYSLIKSKKYIEAFAQSKEMKNNVIISTYNKLFFDFCLINIQHNLKLVSDVHVLDMYSSLIDYPACIDNDSFNIVEIGCLINIVSISSKIDNFDPMNLLYRILTSKKFSYSTSGDSSFLPSIYSNLAKILGAQDEHEKVREISQMGIDYCLNYETSNALVHLLFYKSLALLNLGKEDEALSTVKKCFMQLHIENKPEKMFHFKNIFEREFKMKLDDLIKL